MRKYSSILFAGWLWASWSTCDMDKATYLMSLLPDNRGLIAKVSTTYSPSCIGDKGVQEDNPVLTTVFFPVTQSEAKGRTFEAWIKQANR